MCANYSQLTVRPKGADLKGIKYLAINRAKIVGTGSYLPQNVLLNKDLAELVDTSDDWIFSRTGIRERRTVTDGEALSDLAVNASKNALEMAGISADELDAIIVGTCTPDLPIPSSGCLIQDKLGAKRAFAFDIAAGCTGFIYSLSVAEGFVKSNNFGYILVIGAEVLSKVINWEDRGTCILFADGAGAVVLKKDQEEIGILSTHLHSNGSYWDLLYQPGGGSSKPACRQSIDDGSHYLKMEGNRLFKIAVKALEEVALEAIRHNNITINDLDLWIPHQANIRIIEAVAQRLAFPMEKVFANIHKYGNTSAASIPIALDEANREGRIKKGDLVLLDAFGAGLTWGSVLIRW